MRILIFAAVCCLSACGDHAYTTPATPSLRNLSTSALEHQGPQIRPGMANYSTLISG